MTKDLPLTDFRAVRRVLEPDDFAASGDEVSPTDPIDQGTWHGIMDLPDDVAITTSNHYGTSLKLLYSLWGDWVDSIGMPDNMDELYNCMFDAADCFQCTTFDFVHGFYRSALANLRSALELVTIGTYGNIDPTDKQFCGWKSGASELSFTPVRRRLLEVCKGGQGSWLLESDGPLAIAFRDLCRYTHSRPDASDGALWQSNGPVCNNAGVQLVFKTSLSVYAMCYLLVRIGRPTFKLPNHSRILFELDWLQDRAKLVKAFREFDELR
jgi:hypothetical protein